MAFQPAPGGPTMLTDSAALVPGPFTDLFTICFARWRSAAVPYRSRRLSPSHSLKIFIGRYRDRSLCPPGHHGPERDYCSAVLCILVRDDQSESLTPITECLSPSQEGILIPNFPKATILISVRIWFSSTSAEHRITSWMIV